MKEEKTQKSRTYIPKVYYRGELLNHKETPLTVKETELCPYCKEEITFEQVKHVVPEAEKEITEKILVYLNKYRKDYKLDTCLRKAHFIAQLGAEMKFWKKYFKESPNYNYIGILSLSVTAKKRFGSETIDDTILNSIENKLNDIFKITDNKNKILPKTNSEIKTIINDNKSELKIKISKLYASTKSLKKEENIFIKKDKNKDGKEVVKFNIILKKHKAFGKELLSRAYADRNGNGNELSREGFMFCGRGVKQITGKTNYISFSNFRKKNPFPDDPKGYIDFTKVTDTINHKGNFDLISDTSNVIYAVQSALWFWIEGNGAIYKYAEKDDIESVSRRINGGTNGLDNRRDKTFKARAEKGFKVYKHYEEKHKKGSKEEKESIENQLVSISKDTSIKQTKYDHKKKKNVKIYVNLKDMEAEKLLKKLKEVKPVSSIKPKGLQLKIKSDLKLIPIRNE